MWRLTPVWLPRCFILFAFAGVSRSVDHWGSTYIQRRVFVCYLSGRDCGQSDTGGTRLCLSDSWNLGDLSCSEAVRQDAARTRHWQCAHPIGHTSRVHKHLSEKRAISPVLEPFSPTKTATLSEQLRVTATMKRTCMCWSRRHFLCVLNFNNGT